MTRGDTSMDMSTSRLPGDETVTGGDVGQEQSRSAWQQGEQQQQNVSDAERAVSVAAGAIAAMAGLGRGGLPGLLITAVGGGLIYRGVSGHCPMYQSLDINTAEDGAELQDGEFPNGVRVTTAYMINRSPDDLYSFWRNFENLPQIMTHLESVRVLEGDGRRSHWVAKAPNMGGKQFEWDAELTDDEPGRRIAWRSLPGGDVETSGEVRFEPFTGDRGTNVHVTINYVPPGGRIGHWMLKMLGENPTRVVREDLRNFKRLMETGELPTVEGQSRGTCTGQGKRQTESEWRPLFT